MKEGERGEGQSLTRHRAKKGKYVPRSMLGENSKGKEKKKKKTTTIY